MKANDKYLKNIHIDYGFALEPLKNGFNGNKIETNFATYDDLKIELWKCIFIWWNLQIGTQNKKIYPWKISMKKLMGGNFVNKFIDIKEETGFHPGIMSY